MLLLFGYLVTINRKCFVGVGREGWGLGSWAVKSRGCNSLPAHAAALLIEVPDSAIHPPTLRHIINALLTPLYPHIHYRIFKFRNILSGFSKIFLINRCVVEFYNWCRKFWKNWSGNGKQNFKFLHKIVVFYFPTRFKWPTDILNLFDNRGSTR